ncbi:TetR/AcrR family transcriptional regulator [Actinomadura sp. HBU206391]|uniref:TetR/AcrR family transcriptional regulator n=1 Tax=Actinomadura sp. HBU206391 TaxID=2731692 RepID=UPI001650C99B|nr:TetR/AcrR family transcriptional regulator [Actinomadura sp. HBU206391]MBC6459427.1 TetR family transcriptional regulator [Actinomadura sp. HBU206391]
MNRPRTRDKAATRAALLDAARMRFAQHGYDGTGVREIAGDVGVDPALVFRYFGSKDALYAEAVQAEIPAGLGADRRRPLTHITDALLHDVVFADWDQFDGEHPLLVMLRSSGRPVIRDRLREQICAGYLADFAERLEGEDAALRAELMGALLLGMGVMRSLVGSPALSEATFEQTRVLVARLVATLTEPPPD